jgi:hypothetical protein
VARGGHDDAARRPIGTKIGALEYTAFGFRSQALLDDRMLQSRQLMLDVLEHDQQFIEEQGSRVMPLRVEDHTTWMISSGKRIR